MKQLPCGHQFHQACINKWLNEKRQCPLCRKTVTSPAFLQEPSASQGGIHQQFRITNEGMSPRVDTLPAVVQVPSASQGGTHQQFQITNEGMSPRVDTLPAVVQVPLRNQGGTHQQFPITKEEGRSLSVGITATAQSFPWLLFQKFVSWTFSFWNLRIFQRS
ncbi:hypothetical protein AVEN_6410-1 [Araneus ventricosus]|uniref:RING-type domain-containing protein n=1 Tax=Araneus ventricosus TaxID=182803 RepID=A0A4Y2M0H9_ARAVE|nr:hypothetical protein AVEN_6410-1 [Araneus ventricosus]